ncbi:MAG: tyrosine-type recombinase/integrase [Pseudomonadota bacterium]
MTGKRDPWADLPAGLRVRRTHSGLRVWWEPTKVQRAAGAKPVTLDADRPTWSRRRATDLGRKATRLVEKGPQRDANRTLAELAHEYTGSHSFEDLRPATQRDYRGKLSVLVDVWGHKLVADITKPQVLDLFDDQRARGLPMAKALIRMASILFSYAERVGWRAENTNPCLNLRLKTPPSRDRVADWAEIDALLGAADALDLPGAALMLSLAVFTGQRQTDLMALRADQLVEVDTPQGSMLVMHLVRSKRQNAGVVPIMDADLQDRLELALHGRTDADAVVTTQAQRYTVNTWKRDWLAIRARAAKTVPSVNSLQFRDLRRTFGAVARAAGADKADIAAVLGNTSHINFQLGMTYMPPEGRAAGRAVSRVKRRASDG